MDYNEKHDCRYATKSRANTGIALGSALGGAALLGQLSNGSGLFGGLLGGNGNHKQCEDVLALTSNIYETKIENLQNRFADRQVLDQELFSVYKGQRDGFDILSKRISDLECKEAVNAAVEPWRAKVLEQQIYGVNTAAQNGIALEAERRSCADNKIVNYANSTFYPQYIANVKTDNTSHVAPIYNPLCPCAALV